MCDIDSVLYASVGRLGASHSGGEAAGVGVGGGVGNSSSGSGGDSVAMGTWRADAQHGRQATSAQEESVWYQDSYGTQWS